MTETAELVAEADEGSRVLGTVHADGESDLGELAVALLDGPRVSGEGLHAEGWVGGGATGGLDEAGGGW